jgi:Zn-dependent M16 (insulinase) family peptidase
MKEQAVHHGFVQQEKREIKEIKATATLYRHQKSGAELLHIDAADTNKVFCAAFKTVPNTSNGVPHIIEHSVLNGSKNFPGKSTFMELMKGSLHTFVNAMTGSDMTIYPVASTNATDYMNLARVYMDAVLFPRIYEQPEILQQEGWHHELTDPDGELNIRGVVYNEMKGAFSSPDSVMYRVSRQMLFPDNTYGVESGGDPDVIPELDNESFLAFHKKHYHPSNCRIVTYGDLDINAMLAMLDGDYLCHFDADPHKVEIPVQKPFGKVHCSEYEFPIEEGVSSEGQYHLTMSWSYSRIGDVLESQALSVLMELLMLSPASPLKQKLLESGLASEFYGYASCDMLQPALTIACKNTSPDSIEALIKLVQGELKRIAKQGFDKKLIEAVINSREFFLREGQMRHFPRGLYHAWVILPFWLHNDDPFVMLGFEKQLKEFRKALTEPYFEGLLEKAMIDNKHAGIITFVPVPGLLGKKEQALKEKLAAQKTGMSAKEIAAMVESNKNLLQWQSTPDDPKDIERIPVLNLADIDPKAQEYPMEVEPWKEFTALKHDVNTNGIVYMKAYIDLSHASEEDLPWLAAYAELVGLVDSEHYSYAELSNETDIHTGGINLSLNLMNSYLNPDLILPKYILSGKAVVGKSAKLFELATEYAMKPAFKDNARLQSLIREMKARAKSMLLHQGVVVAINRMFAPFSHIHRWSDITSGLEYYHFLEALEKQAAQDIGAVVHNLEMVRARFFNRQNLIISLTASKNELEEAFNYLMPVVKDISTDAVSPAEHHFHTENINEGIYAPVQVQFCAKGGNFFRKGYSYSGKLRVLKNVLSNEFLYQELRVKGGAYGAMCNFSLAGYQYFCSYRDPNLVETLASYDRVPEYLRSFDCSRREMDKYIIGDVSNLDYPLTPEQIGAAADDDYITGFTQADRQQIRDEVLSTTPADIRSYADMIEAIMVKNHICVFGNEQKVRDAARLFDKLTPVFK